MTFMHFDNGLYNNNACYIGNAKTIIILKDTHRLK